MQNKLSRLLLCESWSSSGISFNLSHRSNIISLFSIPSWLKILDREKLWLHYFLYLRKSLGYDSYLACFTCRAKETYNCICAPGEEELGLAVSHNLWVSQTHVVLQYSNSLWFAKFSIFQCNHFQYSKLFFHFVSWNIFFFKIPFKRLGHIPRAFTDDYYFFNFLVAV